jgi:hypothetical protein
MSVALEAERLHSLHGQSPAHAWYLVAENTAHKVPNGAGLAQVALSAHEATFAPKNSAIRDLAVLDEQL